jgi:hypothetical protein
MISKNQWHPEKMDSEILKLNSKFEILIIPQKSINFTILLVGVVCVLELP